MPRRRLEERQPGFAAGLVRDPLYFIAGDVYEQPDFLQLPETALTAARHARITLQGGLQKLHGTRRVHAAAIGAGSAVLGGFAWRKDDGTVEQLAVANGDLHHGTYAMPMTWTNAGGTLSTSAYPSFAPFRDASGEVVYIADGGPLNKWDGATLTENMAGTPSVRRVWVYNQRLFGVSGDDTLLYWSDLNDGDSLGDAANGGGEAAIRTFGDQFLTTGVALGGSMLLFHANGISRFTGYAQDDIDIDAGAIGHAADVGTLAPRSVVVIDDGGRDVALFMSKRGLYAASEAGVEPVPTPFDRELGALGAANWDDVHAAHHPVNREVWFNVTGFVYIYHYLHKAWTGPHSQIFGSSTPLSLWPSEDDLGAPIVFGGGQDGFVRHCDYPDTALRDVLSDGSGGTAAAMVIEARPWFFGDESLEKAFRHLYLTGQGLGGPATVDVDFVTSTGDTGSVTVTLPATYGTVAVPLWGRGTYLRVSVTDEGAAATLLFAMRAEALALGRRR